MVYAPISFSFHMKSSHQRERGGRNAGSWPLCCLFLIHDFIYSILAVLGSRCCSDFSLPSAIKGYSLVAVLGFSLPPASLAAEHRLLGHADFSSFRLPGSTAHVQYLWCTDLAGQQGDPTSQILNRNQP